MAASAVVWLTMCPVTWPGAMASAAVPPAPLQERLLLGGDAGPAAMEGDGTGLRPAAAVGVTSASGRLIAVDAPSPSSLGFLTLSSGDGSCPTRIEHPDDVETRPGAFSPDEATLAISRYRFIGRYPYWSVELLELATGQRTAVTYGRDPSWSPDGGSLAYDSTAGLLTPPGTLHTIRRDGTGMRDLGVVGTSPVWSPDGTKLAYLGPTGDLRVIDLGTGAVRPVFFLTAPSFVIRWTGDGSGLYFDKRNLDPLNQGIFAVNLDGTGFRRLANGPHHLVDVVRRPDARDRSRYRTVTSTGVVRTFGPGCGPAGWATAASGTGVVGGATAADGLGAWTVTGAGRVAATGQAGTYGDTVGVPLRRPVVGMAGSPSTRGYLLVAGDGGIFGFGDAPFYGSTGGIRLNQPVVGMAFTPGGGGYWLVASDGGIFAFGDARFYGSTGGIRLNRPVVGMAATPSGGGYWLVASDGGIFAFGDAPFFGSTGGVRLNRPVTGMAATPSGTGYRLAADDGGVFPFGDAPFFGSGVGAPGGATVEIVS